jgi:hypothetical protein
MLSPVQYWIVLLAVSAYAFAFGRRDERAAVVTCVVATVGSVLLNSQLAERFSHVEWGVMTVDVLTFIAFTLIAIRTDRFWPLWVAGFQLTTLMAHLLKAIQFDLMPQAYAAAARLWVYPIFLAIVIGTWRSHRRRAAARGAPSAA